ncbi:hypothetical protein RO3G_05164 [Rhizopus delemar RA 99-880]|uniref:Uncharacterized protein n=1 Tax=Rhizopus delemar (strain RA 99-880 / ATCC MYA-4621 / FGSC 9543 / NRRL 43880) TaxID=246409 RepID=I1BW79_RHIO9|nr:hypothetical protein RO3G_05164 [Rhizopus delemar RA 99-880]|eukprot:EIE80459.1 hypothetical protein RO3G_05164 [Rhizopus delemar RA 99-880]
MVIVCLIVADILNLKMKPKKTIVTKRVTLALKVMNITHDPKMHCLMLKLYTEKMLKGEKFIRHCTLQDNFIKSLTML